MADWRFVRLSNPAIMPITIEMEGLPQVGHIVQLKWEDIRGNKDQASRFVGKQLRITVQNPDVQTMGGMEPEFQFEVVE